MRYIGRRDRHEHRASPAGKPPRIAILRAIGPREVDNALLRGRRIRWFPCHHLLRMSIVTSSIPTLRGSAESDSKIFLEMGRNILA